MHTEILQPLIGSRFTGMRVNASPVRDRIEKVLSQGKDVAIDFSNLEATQAFVDELFGVLILRHGPEVLERVVFRGCSENMRAIIEFVAADRADQFSKSTPH